MSNPHKICTESSPPHINQRSLVSGVNCLPELAYERMTATKKHYGKEDGIAAYHGYQSFAPGEVTPDQCHAIGVELAKRLWGGRFEVLVATHVDKESHLHNHFVLNSVSFRDGLKFRCTKSYHKVMWRESDKLCREYGLSVIQNPHRTKQPRGAWMASIYRRENGTYCVRVYYGVHNGVQKVVSKTYTPPKGMTQKAIEKDQQRFAKRFEEMVHSGEFVPGAEIKMQDTRSAYMTVAQFIPFYYLPRAEERLSPNTMRFYRTIIDQFILPSYGELRLIDLRKEHLQQFIDYLAYNTEARADGKGGTLSAPTIKRYASVFRAVVTAAYDTGFLEDDPFAHGKVDYPKDTRPVRVGEKFSKAYGMEEINIFLRALRKEKPLDRILLLTSVVIGARRSEVVVLKWEDVDFDRGCLYIDKSAYKVKGEKQALKAPKSEQGYRDVYFPDIYKNELLSWRDEQEKQRTAAGDGWQEQGFIFTNHKGDMVSLYSLTRLCEEFEKKNDIRHLKLHGLRHTFDSVLCSKGVGMETLKEIMGHKSISTTEIYTHALTEDKQNAAKVMNEVIAAFAEGEEEPDGTDDSPEAREEMAGA